MPGRSIDTGREANTGRDTEANTGRDTPVLTEITLRPRSDPKQTTQDKQGTLRNVSGRSITDKEKTPVTPQTQFRSKPLNASDMPDFFGVPSLAQDSGVPNGVTQPKSFGSNPLGILADLFASSYGRAPVESPQAPIVVGDVSAGSGGGSNAGLLVLLAIVGIVGYFIYKRIKQ